jgi:4-hydroxy-3-methylbut-2-enyl diphosphate reductase
MSDVVLAKPRGFCAGVERAIKVVELALERYGAPVFVRKEIVHNTHVVARLRVPPPAVYAQAAERGLRVIDATCPLVTKVHAEVKRYVKRGYRIVFIGHRGHDEVEGTMGQAPEHTILVETLADVASLALRPDERGVILTQTTLSQDDTHEIVRALQARFPLLELPPTEDICYATQNRQNAVKQMLLEHGVDLLLVVGSKNSSNSQRLTEVARARGVASHLIDGPDQIDPTWLQGRQHIGVTSGASAPEDVVQAVLQWLRDHHVGALSELPAPDENVVFNLPAFTHLTRNGKVEA